MRLFGETNSKLTGARKLNKFLASSVISLAALTGCGEGGKGKPTVDELLVEETIMEEGNPDFVFTHPFSGEVYTNEEYALLELEFIEEHFSQYMTEKQKIQLAKKRSLEALEDVVEEGPIIIDYYDNAMPLIIRFTKKSLIDSTLNFSHYEEWGKTKKRKHSKILWEHINRYKKYLAHYVSEDLNRVEDYIVETLAVYQLNKDELKELISDYRGEWLEFADTHYHEHLFKLSSNQPMLLENRKIVLDDINAQFDAFVLSLEGNSVI